ERLIGFRSPPFVTAESVFCWAQVRDEAFSGVTERDRVGRAKQHVNFGCPRAQEPPLPYWIRQFAADDLDVELLQWKHQALGNQRRVCIERDLFERQLHLAPFLEDALHVSPNAGKRPRKPNRVNS